MWSVNIKSSFGGGSEAKAVMVSVRARGADVAISLAGEFTMKRILGAFLFLAGLSSLSPSESEAQPILQQRCNVDSLTPAQAEARLAWARRCALTLHVNAAVDWFDTGMVASNGGGNLIEYLEDDQGANWSGMNSYVGQGNGFEVNYTTLTNLYNSGPISQYTDANGFKRWERPLARKKARPYYPTYGSQYDINSGSNVQLFPHPTNANDCNLYLNQAGTTLATGYSYFVNGFCESSCYTPEQRVLFPDGYSKIVDAVGKLKPNVVTLAADSSLDSIRLQSHATYSYTAEFRDSSHPIVELTMASGGKLRVTLEHPLVNGEGRLVQAQTVKVGEELIKIDGSRDPIIGVKRTEHFGRVYNLRPATEDRVSNLLIAEDYVVGSSLFQNDEIGYINRIILHKSMPSTLIP